MARGKKKRREKHEQKNLTTMALCCANYMYCNTIDDLSLLCDIKKEIYRLHGIGMISSFIAYEIISNVSRRAVNL